MQDMVTLDGTPAVPTQFGCTASPTISLPGLKVDAANGSPIATHTGTTGRCPPIRSGLAGRVLRQQQKPFDFKWQTPVTELNVTFQGPAAQRRGHPAAGLNQDRDA